MLASAHVAAVNMLRYRRLAQRWRPESRSDVGATPEASGHGAVVAYLRKLIPRSVAKLAPSAASTKRMSKLRRFGSARGSPGAVAAPVGIAPTKLPFAPLPARGHAWTIKATLAIIGLQGKLTILGAGRSTSGGRRRKWRPPESSPRSTLDDKLRRTAAA